MKIVQIIPALGIGGAEIMCENLIYALRQRKHDVVVISMFHDQSAITDRLKKAGVDVRYLDKKPGLDLSMMWKMRKILVQEKADVAHTHLYCTKYAVPAAILAGVKTRVHTIHTMAKQEIGGLSRKLNKLFYKFCNVTPVALSEEVCKSIVEEYGLPDEKVPVVFNGIDLSRCITKENYALHGAFKIVHTGRFCEAKNHLGLLNAFHMFHKKYPDSELWLIGDGETRADAEKYVQNSGLENAVKFMGSQSNVFPFLSDADIFTLTSHYEGISLALIEAMGTGLPIVATAVGGVPDMINEDNSILVAVEDHAIAEAFERYYLNPDLRQQHGHQVRKASKKFASDTMAANYEHIYFH